MTFWEECQNNFSELSKKIKKTLHARIYHEQARAIYKEPQKHSKPDVAWAVWVLSTMSFGSKLNTTFGYDRGGSIASRIDSKRKAFTDAISTRLEKVTIEKRDALELIRIFDSEETFFYLDPPYFNSACGHYSGYSEADFADLLVALSNIRGKFLLSSFPSDVLSRFKEKNNWNQKTIERTISVCNNARPKRIEVLTSNFEQKKLFLN